MFLKFREIFPILQKKFLKIYFEEIFLTRFLDHRISLYLPNEDFPSVGGAEGRGQLRRPSI